jgi:hypothetical protein
MLTAALASVGALSLLTFLVPFLVLAFLWKPQNLKDKYQCEWALVTGSSSGIGRALTEKLCGQGLNVVMVALDDKLLDDSHKDIAAKFPAVTVAAVKQTWGAFSGATMRCPTAAHQPSSVL